MTGGCSPYVAEELLELLQLAVGQRVHRVDDDGARARRRIVGPGLEDRVDDRDEEASDLPEPVPVVTT